MARSKHANMHAEHVHLHWYWNSVCLWMPPAEYQIWISDHRSISQWKISIPPIPVSQWFCIEIHCVCECHRPNSRSGSAIYFPVKKPKLAHSCGPLYSDWTTPQKMYMYTNFYCSSYPYDDQCMTSQWRTDPEQNEKFTGTFQEGRVSVNTSSGPLWDDKLVFMYVFYCFLLISDHCWSCISQWFSLMNRVGRASVNYAKLC